MSVEETPQYIVTTPGDGDEDNKVTITSKSISHTTRSHSLQSSTATIIEHSNTPFSLVQQHKAISSANITSEKHFQTKSTSTTTKGKFQSFLQHPDPASTSHGTTYISSSAQQKHIRQFVRSTSAHSESGSNKPDKCIRSASTQIDDSAEALGGSSSTITSTSGDQTNRSSLQQASTILISKSAETFESKMSTGVRTQLTLSGGLLAPPNRKLTILSPIHAPPGLHDMLKRHGRSPLSPRISFPGADSDLFP